MQRGVAGTNPVRRRLLWGVITCVSGVLIFAYVAINSSWLHSPSPTVYPLEQPSDQREKRISSTAWFGNPKKYAPDRIEKLEDGNVDQLRYTVVVLTYDRFPSLDRLLKSLRAADYEGDNVDLLIHVDYPASPNAVPGWRQCVDLVKNFDWPLGRKTLNIRSFNVGLRHAWFQAFYPPTNNDIGNVLQLFNHPSAHELTVDQGVIFEEDVEASPLWFRFTKKVVANYYDDPRMAFLCLYPLYQKGFQEFGFAKEPNSTHEYCPVCSLLLPPPNFFFCKRMICHLQSNHRTSWVRQDSSNNLAWRHGEGC